MKNFIWFATQDKLPTKWNLKKRNISQDENCPLCGSDIEDVSHVLKICLAAKTLWQCLRVPPLLLNHHPQNFALWLKTACSSNELSPFFHGAWETIIAFGCWILWKARNRSIFELASPSLNAFKESLSAISEFLFLGAGDVSCFKRKQQINVHWTTPPEPFFKLNTDGSSLGNPGNAGAGGLITNYMGEWVGGFTRNLGVASNIAAELWALRDGLFLAKCLNIVHLIVELDAKVVVDLLNNQKNATHEFAPLIFDCRTALESFQTAQIKHIYRETNRCADFLAKMGATTN